MRLLSIHDRLSGRGGADWHLLSLLDSLPAEIERTCLFGRDDGSVPAGFSPWERILFLPGLDRKAPYAHEARASAALARTIETLRPDLIHAHNVLSPGFLETIGRAGPPTVMTVQDHRFFCPGRGKVREDRSICRAVFGPACAGCFREEAYFLSMMDLVRARLAALQGFDALITLSAYMRDELVRVGLPAEKIAVIPPFAHGLSDESPPEEAVAAGRGEAVLYSGRLTWTKGVFDLLEALMLMPGQARLIVAGTGPAEPAFRDRVKELGLENRVRFEGWVEHPNLARVFREARLLALPSLWQEPFGLSGLEALSMARPVVAYAGGGVSEWLDHGRSGLLAAPGGVTGLAEAMTRLLDRPDLAERMGRAGRETAAARFNRARLMDRLLGVYRGLLQKSA
jgi:glycosyltransferase involved in cell wall biosynthesis